MSHGIRWNSFIRFAICLMLLIPAWTRAAKPSIWIKVHSPNFVVITDGNEKQARKVAYQFEMFRSVLRSFASAKGTETDPPVTIIAAKDEDSLKALEPEANLAKGAAHLTGLFLDGPEKKYVLLRMDASIDQDAAEPFETIYHEYVHYFTRRLIPHLPLWLSEGLAEFYGNTRFEGKYALVGTASTINLEILQTNPILPLSTLYAVDASSPYYHEENKTSVFYAESWALTHYLMTRDWNQKTDQVRQFVLLLQKDVPMEEAARRTLGDPRAIEDALEAYVRKPAFLVARVNLPGKIDANDFARDPLSEAESLAARGYLLVLVRRYADAETMLTRAIQADPKLAAGYEGMGFLYSVQQKYDEASKWFAQSVEMNSEGMLANFLYATNLFKTRLDKETADKAEKCLRTALRTDPNFAPAYDALAYLLLTTSRGAEEAQRLALQAVALEPGNVQYRLRVANALEQLNQPDNAIRVATLARSMARTIAEESEADNVLESAQRMQEYKRRNQDVAGRTDSIHEAAQLEAPSERSDQPSAPGEKGQEDAPGPPKLRHRDSEAPLAEDNPPALSHHLELGKPIAFAGGIISEVACSKTQGLKFTLISKPKNLHFYTDNYFDVAFRAANFTPKGVMNPCSDLEGMQARIIYRPVKGSPDEGQLVEVQLTR